MGRRSTAKSRLLDSARDLIHANNYGAASVEAVCAAAGVNKGSFYYFFASKRDLALTVLDEQWSATQTFALDRAFERDVPPLERIRRFFRLAASLQSAPTVRGCPFGNLAVEMGSIDPVLRAKVAHIFGGYQGYFHDALEEAALAGEIPRVDTGAAARRLLAYLQGALVLAKAYNDASLVEDMGQHALLLVGAASDLEADSCVE